MSQQLTLVQARELVGWTQSELARRAGESVSNIRDLEQGENGNPSWGLVSRVVGALQKGGLKNLRPEHIFPVETRKTA
jgi:transcriptional regulator with XRE-family HTH domain